MGYRPEYVPIFYYYPKPKDAEEKDESTMGQVKPTEAVKDEVKDDKQR